jgi:error-prone DNA polymerase
MYIELHAASAFSFLEAASLPETLVDRAAELGYAALALLDRDGVQGAPRFHMAARKAGLKPLIGAELTMKANGIKRGVEEVPQSGRAVAGRASSTSVPPWESPHPPFLWRLPVLVASREGYRNLCRLITRMKLAAPKGEGSLQLEDLDGKTTGLVALAGRATLTSHRYGVGGLLDRLVGIFGRSQVYVELQRHLHRDEEADNQALCTLASAFRVPVMATNGVRFATPEDRPLYEVLTCVRHKTTLSRAGQRLARNAEHYLKSPAQMARLFDDLPEALAASRELADRLEYTMADLGYRFPEYPVPQGETMISFLRKVAEVGARDRYRPFHDRARAQLARELDLIEQLDLAGYFLIVWDIVNFCRQHGILVQGRGSAANSAVCYSLGITAVDPVGMDLLFERFLSAERGEWPDIDLDLPSGDRREQVIQYLYERYGRLGAAMTANVITYRGRSAAREVGKVLDLDAGEIDRLAKVMHNFEWRDPNESLERNLRDAGIETVDTRVRQFGALWGRIQNLPRHLGQHSGGMVICRGRLDEVVPLENATMPGRVVIQWDKDDCADMGIVKVDLLGLGMMAVLQDALSIVNGQDDGSPSASSSARVDLARLPADDPAVYRMLQDADTIGIFQVESRAQMATLPRLRPTCFYDLVVEVAIIRPGPIVGQMVHPYLKRRKGLEPVTYLHPTLEPILARTLGVPLFQEQLLRIAMVAAGFTGGEAEELRRAMGFKRSEERMRRIETRLRAGMARNGIEGEAAETILRAISSFALYGFPESHAASFALLVYASAYFKVYYPAAFFAAMLNNQPMGFYHPATLVKDAQRRGVRFTPIDVQASRWDCVVDSDGAIRLGLRYVQGLREEVGKRIAEFGSDRVSSGSKRVAWRCTKCGNDDASLLEVEGTAAFCNNCAHAFTVPSVTPRDTDIPPSAVHPPPRFRSLEHLIDASGLRREELATLAEIGALNAFGYDRREALWQIERAVRPEGELFSRATPPPSPHPDPPPRVGGESQGKGRTSPLSLMTPLERVIADYEGTSLTIGPHPMALRRRDMTLRGVLCASDLPRTRHGRRIRVAGAVITRQRPGTAKGFVFLTLEDETGIANIIVKPGLFDAYRMTIIEEPFLLVEGVLQQQDQVTSVSAEKIFALGGHAPAVESHDFR